MILYVWLGRVGYLEGLALQREMVELRHRGLVENVLLLLEHPPVLTLGRNANRGNIVASDAVLAARGVEVHEINRGGDVTYHGPGQLVGYPIFDLRSLSNDSGGRLGPVEYVRRMEESLIRVSAGLGVITGRVKGRTGIWTSPGSTALAEKKVGAIGVHVSRGITSHGFALNVTTDLRDFQWIVPCGIEDREVTSLEEEMRDPEELPSLEGVGDRVARQFGLVFGETVMGVETLESLRSSVREREAGGDQAGGAGVAGGIRQVGQPMVVPGEIERLRGGDGDVSGMGRPIRA